MTFELNALGMLEYTSIARGIDSADQMVKTAEVKPLFFKTICPGKYLTAVRIDAAKRFLAAHAWPLDVVASLCGFSGANYFCRVFRRETGLSPAAFRAANTFAAPPEGNEADEWYL